MTPKEYFDRKYGLKVERTHTFFSRERNDDFTKDFSDIILKAKNNQDYCNQITEQTKGLLNSSEKECLGDFYFGVTPELLFHSSIEKIGESFLILIHRRLFNAIQFYCHLFVNQTILPQIKLELLNDYFESIAISPYTETRLPESPDHSTIQENISYSSLFQSSIRYILCHELGHVLPITKHPVFDKFILRLETNFRFQEADEWIKEIKSDMIGCSIPLRIISEQFENQGNEDLIADLQTISIIDGPFIVNLVLGIRKFLQNKIEGKAYFDQQSTHPPSTVRCKIIQEFLELYIPRFNNVVKHELYETLKLMEFFKH